MKLRTRRRKYYDIFSHFYDAFIRMHSRQDEDDTRSFLVNAAHLENKPAPRILDICCGTGAVILSFAEHHAEAGAIIGYDFSHGMLRKAQEKNRTGRAVFVEGDAANLPFADDGFDVVTCSHALYELKGDTRQKALNEMKRVVRPDGYVLLMEHEVPKIPFSCQDAFHGVEGRARIHGRRGASEKDISSRHLEPFPEWEK